MCMIKMINEKKQVDPLFSILEMKDGKLQTEKKQPLSKIKVYILNKLNNMGIDIQKDSYDSDNNAAFRKLDKFFLSDENGYVMSESWFAEKYLVGQERLEKKYSVYAMCVTRQLTATELDPQKLYDTLHAIYAGDVERNITRKGDKDGLLTRLKNVGFDLDSFDGQNEQKLRLLFLLYSFEHDTNIVIGDFFSKPTAENRDISYIGASNKNGELMHYLKSNIEKHIQPKIVSEINYEFGKILAEWQQQFSKLLFKVDTFHEMHTRDDLGMTNNLVMHIFREDSLVDEDKCGPYRRGVIESFYLMILEYESIGLELDLIDIAEWEMSTKHTVAKDMILQKYKNQAIYKSEIKYFLDENKKEFIRYIYSIDNAKKNDIKRYRRLVDKVNCFLVEHKINN